MFTGLKIDLLKMKKSLVISSVRHSAFNRILQRVDQLKLSKLTKQSN